MSHPEQREFISSVRQRFPGFFRSTRVLEVGSLDINGSVRDFFHDCDYLGVDLGPGPGVDLVIAGEDLSFPDNSFDVCISTECFEHNPSWRETFRNMCRMSRGLVIVTAATDGRPEHGTRRTTPSDSPFTAELSDYYANVSVHDMESIGLDSLFVKWDIATNPTSHDIYFWGAVRPEGNTQLHPFLFPAESDATWIAAADQAVIRRDEGKLAERDQAVRERDELQRRLRDIESSRTWRLTEPYRRLRARLK